MKLTTLFAPIERLIEEHGSSSIQGKHIAFLREQLSILKEQFAIAQRRVEQLESENADLRKQLQQAKPSGFVESEGLLWKRSGTGFESRPYCPVSRCIL
jgi:hypothetical protein